MQGLINIFIEKSTNKISILVYHVTMIGFYESMGYMLEIDNLDNLNNLKNLLINI